MKKRTRSASEIASRKASAAKLHQWRRIRRPPVWPLRAEDFVAVTPEQPASKRGPKPQATSAVERMVAARSVLLGRINRVRNAGKQARTSARQARLEAGAETRARVAAAFREDPSARAVDIADSLTSEHKPDGVDVSTVYRARKPKR